MFLIVGLGNPGKEYQKTRHNVGFSAIEKIKTYYNMPQLQEKKEFEGAFAKTTINNMPIVLFTPLTYMNLSGQALGKIAHYFKIPFENIIVLYDDIDLPLETIRIKKDGRSGGHNGIKSIIEHIGENFIRIKIGIKPDREKRGEAVSVVLGKFTKQEQSQIEKTMDIIPYVIEEILNNGVEEAQNKYN